MKKYGTAIFLIVIMFLFSGCSLFKKADTASSEPVKEESPVDKSKIESSNAEYKAAIDKLRQDHVQKREQTEQERLAKYKASFDAVDLERDKKAQELIKWTQGELETWNKEQLKIISETYNAEVNKIEGQELNDEQRKKVLQTAAANKGQSEFNQKVAYENKKVLLERIKRNYSEDIKNLKYNTDKNMEQIKKAVSEKYAKEYEKITSTYNGPGSDWEKLLKREQEEIAKLSEEENLRFNNSVKKLDSWLKSELNRVLN